MQDIFDMLDEAEVFIEITQQETQKEDLYLNKCYVMTGALKNHTREAAATIIQNYLKGKVKCAITSATDYLIVADSAKNSSKLQKTNKYPNVKIMSEKEFEKIIRKYGYPNK